MICKWCYKVIDVDSRMIFNTPCNTKVYHHECYLRATRNNRIICKICKKGSHTIVNDNFIYGNGALYFTPKGRGLKSFLEELYANREYILNSTPFRHTRFTKKKKLLGTSRYFVHVYYNEDSAYIYEYFKINPDKIERIKDIMSLTNKRDYHNFYIKRYDKIKGRETELNYIDLSYDNFLFLFFLTVIFMKEGIILSKYDNLWSLKIFTKNYLPINL